MSADRRRRGPRLIGPAIAALVRELARPAGEQTVELRLSAAAADAIARYGNSTVLFDQIISTPIAGWRCCWRTAISAPGGMAGSF